VDTDYPIKESNPDLPLEATGTIQRNSLVKTKTKKKHKRK
jgi:hypothetical protein